MRTVVRCLLLALPAVMLAAEVAVAHASVPSEQLAERALRNALLGRITIWDGGVPVVLVLSRDEQDRVSMTEISGRELGRLLRGWKRLTFSGSWVMPLVVDDRAAAIARVAETRGAVAILDLPADADLPPGLQRVDLTAP